MDQATLHLLYLCIEFVSSCTIPLQTSQGPLVWDLDNCVSPGPTSSKLPIAPRVPGVKTGDPGFPLCCRLPFPCAANLLSCLVQLCFTTALFPLQGLDSHCGATVPTLGLAPTEIWTYILASPLAKSAAPNLSEGGEDTPLQGVTSSG